MAEQQERPATDQPAAEPGARRPIALWLVPLLAAIVLPGLEWMVAEQPMAIHPHTARGMSMWVALVAVVILALLSGGFRRRLRWALSVTTVTTLVIFHWPNLTSAGSNVAGLLRVSLLADIVPVLLAWVFIWLATRLGNELEFALLSSTATVLVVLFLLVSVLPYRVDGPVPVPVATPPPDAPDALLLILDGYARADVLDEFYGLDNASFLDELDQLGFTVATEASPNYSFTYASISSILDLDYVYDEGPITPSHHERMRNALSGDAAIMRSFRQAGYEIAFVESAWQGSYCGTAVDVCVRDGHVERMLWNLGQLTILAPLLENVQPSPFSTVSQQHLESLAEIVAANRRDGVPRLTIAHVLIPHPPLLLDADCERHLTEARRDEVTADPDPAAVEARIGYYADQTRCTNRLVTDQLRQIIESRDDTFVMITADHGAGSLRVGFTPLGQLTADEITERMGILSAYRLPDCPDTVYPTITPINGARALTDCALGTSLGLLPDNHYWIAGNGEGEAIPIGVTAAGTEP